MDNKLLVYFSIVVLVLLVMTGLLFFSPTERFHDYFGFGLMQVPPIIKDVDHGPRYATGTNLVAGICALLLVGYLFWNLYRKHDRKLCRK